MIIDKNYCGWEGISVLAVCVVVMLGGNKNDKKGVDNKEKSLRGNMKDER